MDTGLKISGNILGYIAVEQFKGPGSKLLFVMRYRSDGGGPVLGVNDIVKANDGDIVWNAPDQPHV